VAAARGRSARPAQDRGEGLRHRCFPGGRRDPPGGSGEAAVDFDRAQRRRLGFLPAALAPQTAVSQKPSGSPRRKGHHHAPTSAGVAMPLSLLPIASMQATMHAAARPRSAPGAAAGWPWALRIAASETWPRGIAAPGGRVEHERREVHRAIEVEHVAGEHPERKHVPPVPRVVQERIGEDLQPGVGDEVRPQRAEEDEQRDAGDRGRRPPMASDPERSPNLSSEPLRSVRRSHCRCGKPTGRSGRRISGSLDSRHPSSRRVRRDAGRVGQIAAVG